MKLLKALVVMIGLSGAVWAGPSSPPAGNFILNVSTFGGATAFNVTSGTIRTQLYLPFATANQCLQTDILKNVVSAACLSGGGGGSSMAFNQNGVTITSPTLAVNALSPPFILTSVGAGTTVQWTVDYSSITAAGNSFNGASQLVQNDFAGALPALSAVNLTNIPSANLSGPVPAANLSNAILNQGSVQASSQFHVSSGTVSGNALMLTLNQPGIGSVYQGVGFNQQGVLRGYLRQDDYSGLCSDVSTTCYSLPFELGFTSSSVTAYYFNSDGRLFTIQNAAGFRANAYSSVIGGSLIVGGTGNKNYTDTQQIGDGNIFANNGVIASTINLQGTGDAKITMTVGSSTFTATYSSGSYSIGQFAVYSSTNGALIGSNGTGVATPSGLGQLQFNNAGTFGGVSSSVVTGTSVTFRNNVAISTLTVLNTASASTNVNPGILDVYGTSMGVGTNIATFGSSSHVNVLNIRSGTYPDASAYGMLIGGLLLGDQERGWPNRVQSFGDIHNYVDVRSSNTMQFHTDSGGSPGTLGDMMFWPAETLMVNMSTATGITMGVQTSTVVIQGNLVHRGGMYLSTWTANGTAGVVATTYQAGPTDNVIFANASAGAFTITLATSANVGQVITVYKSDASTQAVTGRAAGTDLINGTTQQFILHAIGQSAELIAGAGGWWSHGIGIQATPSALNALGKQNASVAIGVSSSIYTCVMDIPVPVSVLGFRYTGIAMASPAQIAFGLYDRAGNIVVSTGPVYGVVGLGTVSLGSSYVNLPAGQYYIGTQASNTAVSMTGGANGASNAFCEVTAATAMGMPASVTVVGGSATGRNYSTYLMLNGGRTTE